VRCRPAAFGAIGCVVLATIAGAAHQDRGSDDPRLALVRKWVTAVDQHEPGEIDSALLTAGTRSRADLELLLIGVDALFTVVDNPNTRRVNVLLRAAVSRDSGSTRYARPHARCWGRSAQRTKPHW
jgi:hypothetical protein